LVFQSTDTDWNGIEDSDEDSITNARAVDFVLDIVIVSIFGLLLCCLCCCFVALGLLRRRRRRTKDSK
jgi:hypothetical protein